MMPDSGGIFVNVLCACYWCIDAVSSSVRTAGDKMFSLIESPDYKGEFFFGGGTSGHWTRDRVFALVSGHCVIGGQGLAIRTDAAGLCP